MKSKSNRPLITVVLMLCFFGVFWWFEDAKLAKSKVDYTRMKLAAIASVIVWIDLHENKPLTNLQLSDSDAILLKNDFDAWGMEIILRLSDPAPFANVIVVSSGKDKLFDTEDDLIALAYIDASVNKTASEFLDMVGRKEALRWIRKEAISIPK